MRIIDEIKSEYTRRKTQTLFMGVVVILAVLSYIKPSSTRGFLTYIGITAVNFIFLALAIILTWWFYGRKNGK